MTEKKGSPWPQNEDGVTDWEFVFEDPSSGFIPLIMMAHSPLILKECGTVVIQKLFTRDDDGMNIMKFIIALDEIIPDDKEFEMGADTLNGMRSQVSQLLRNIKAERIKQSKSYLKNKSRKASERRISS